MAAVIDLGGRTETSGPLVMGIVNVTPDSFSDGGRFFDTDRAIEHGLSLARDGADIIDVGGESTRPRAAGVDVAEEIERVVPVVEALAARAGVPVSVDTSTPEVMRAAVGAGAAMINDVRALRREGALEAAVESGVPVCLMHMQGDPRTMQVAPHYDDVVSEVRNWLEARVAAAIDAGIPRCNLVIDPGFGFGKNLDHNLELLRHLGDLAALGLPVLAGLSRKSMIVRILGAEPVSRLSSSIALALCALYTGARILRVHDVRETVEAVRVWCAVRHGA